MKRMPGIVVVLLFISFSFIGLPDDVYATQWVKTYGGT